MYARVTGTQQYAQDEGFDFDAHVARLMEASAKETGLRQRTADDNLQTKGLSRLRRDSDGESDDDSEGGGGGIGSDDSGEIDDALLEGLDINGGEEEGGELGEGTEERAALDSQFEAVSVCCRRLMMWLCCVGICLAPIFMEFLFLFFLDLSRVVLGSVPPAAAAAVLVVCGAPSE